MRGDSRRGKLAGSGRALGWNGWGLDIGTPTAYVPREHEEDIDVGQVHDVVIVAARRPRRPLLLRWIVIHRRSVDQAARLFQAGAPSGAEGDGIAREQHQLARRLCPSRRRRRRPLGCTLVQPRGLLALPRRVRRRRPQLIYRRWARLPESSLASGYESRSADVRERSHGQAFLWPCVLQPSQS